MSSLRQILANRQNAQRSTGPRTAAGKAQSRRNALKHGLAGQGVVWPEEQGAAIATRLDQWTEDIQPATSYEHWLVGVMATEAVRFDLAQSQENELQAWLAQRASGCWEADRQLEVEELAGRLRLKPALTVARLRQTSQGVAWLIAVWQALGQAIHQPGGWTEIERGLALDLLGIPRELRREGQETPLDPSAGQPEAEAAEAIVATEIAALEQLRAEALDDLDTFERSAAERGLAVRPDRRLTLLRRYQAACFRRLQWAVRELRTSRLGQIVPPPRALFEPASEHEHKHEPEPQLQPEAPEPLPLVDAVAPTPTPVASSYVGISITPPPRNHQERRARRKRRR